MKKLLFILAAVAFLFTACLENEIVAPYLQGATAEATQPLAGEDVIITATVLKIQHDITSVVIEWGRDGVQQTAISMNVAEQTTSVGGQAIYTYIGTIPGQNDEVVVTWRVVVTKGNGDVETSSWGRITWLAEIMDFSVLRLNEISGEDNVLFVEIFNSGTEAVNLEGVKLQRNEGVAAGGTEWVGQAGDVIPAGAYRIILFRNGRSDGNNSGADAPSVLQQLDAWPGMSWIVTGGLSNQQILKIALVEPDGTPIDVFIRGDAPLPNWGTTGQDRPSAVPTPADLLALSAYGTISATLRPSYSRMADGSWAYAVVTPGATNGEPTGQIVNSGYLTAMP